MGKISLIIPAIDNARNISGIYSITSPSGKIYIGMSVNIANRWTSYATMRCSQQPYLYNSLKKYGVKNHVFDILEVCDKDELSGRELYYIKKINTTNPDVGLNIVLKFEETENLKARRIELKKRDVVLRKRKLKKLEYNRKYNATKRLGERKSEPTPEDIRKYFKQNKAIIHLSLGGKLVNLLETDKEPDANLPF